MASKTARQLLTLSLRRIGILSETEAMQADQAAAGLDVLNLMLAGFPTQGIHYTHTDIESLDGTVNVPDEQVRNVMLMLARELADEYGAAAVVSPQLEGAMREAKVMLQAYYHRTTPAVIDPALTGGSGSFDITRG